MGDHTRNYCAAIYFFLVTYIFFLHEPRVIDPALSSDGDKVGWCLTKRGRTRGCINKEKLGSNTRKNTIQKNCHTKNVRVFSHTKKYHTKKLPYKKNVSVFSTHTKKYYEIHAKKLLVFFTIQKIAIHFFPYKKLLCSAHIQKITMYSHTQKITYKKKC